jgi:hypothetical protein
MEFNFVSGLGGLGHIKDKYLCMIDMIIVDFLI